MKRLVFALSGLLALSALLAWVFVFRAPAWNAMTMVDPPICLDAAPEAKSGWYKDICFPIYPRPESADRASGAALSMLPPPSDCLEGGAVSGRSSIGKNVCLPTYPRPAGTLLPES
jgi:hypothetical protein